MPITNLINLLSWFKKVWRKFMIYCFLLAVLFVTVRCDINVYDDIQFIAKLLMNLLIGGFFCHGVLINIDFFLGISHRFSKEYESNKRHGHSFKNSGCNICGDAICIKQPYISQEPWSNLMVDCRLDYAVQQFFETIINNYITDWYVLYSNKCEFVDELKAVLKFSSSKLVRRIQNIHFGKLIMNKLIPCGLQHFDIFYYLKRTSKHDESPDYSVLKSVFVRKLHPALSSRESELEYLRNVTTAIMPLLLRPQDLDNQIFCGFIRELFARWVLLPLLDLLADPRIVNILLVLLTDGKKMTEIQKEPSVKTEFLHKFSKDGPNLRHRCKSLKIPIRRIMKEPSHLYTFMQFMKSNSKVHLLQFCLDVDGFNDKLLCPDLDNDEKIALYNKANYIYQTYFHIDSSLSLNFPDDIVMEMHEILKDGSANIVQLQTSQAIFEAYEYAYNLLQNEWAPKFYHSREFYYGFLNSTNDELSLIQGTNSMLKVGNKVKDKFKMIFLNGQLLSIYEDLKMYLDPNKSADFNLGISKMDVTIEEIFHRMQADWKSDVIYVINCQSNHKGKTCNWVVERKEDEFYVLQEKLVEIYSFELIKGFVFPLNRSNIPNDFIKIKFEKFLQYIVKHDILCTDNLVCLFLTDGDVAFIKQRESYPISKFGNKSQSPASKMQSQKLEFLGPFLKFFFDGVDRDEDEEESEEFQDNKNNNLENIDNIQKNANENWNMRLITDGIFKNNFNLKQVNTEDTKIEETASKSVQDVKGFCDCIVYLMIAVFQFPTYICFIICNIPQTLRRIVDMILENYLNHYLRDVFCEVRLAYLISLGHDLLFTDKSLSNKMTSDECKMKAKEQIHAYVNSYILPFMGDSIFVPVDAFFELVQIPRLNKQLLLSLFDLLIKEILPEIADNDKV